MDVDQVHEMMDDIQEQQELSKEISEAISNPVAFGTVDEDELEAELAELDAENDREDQEAIEKQLISVEPSTNLPDVPTAEPKAVAKKKEEDKELSALADWASWEFIPLYRVHFKLGVTEVIFQF